MSTTSPRSRKMILCLFIPVILLMLLGAYLVSACTRRNTTPKLAKEIIFADWEGDMPQSVLDAFTAEYGVKVIYDAYAEQETMMDEIRKGRSVDVVVLESRLVPAAVRDGLLKPIDYNHVTNFKNISANFRGLAYDPENEYSIPFNWGTTALLVRSDWVETPVTRWADLWNPVFAGRTGIWLGQKREVIALTLKSLGYSANSENEQELQAALECLIALKRTVVYLEDYDQAYAAKAMVDGGVIAAMGYAGDIAAAEEMDLELTYIYPEEGALMWGDNFVIPANSPSPATAELFINFLLRPEISAQIANENHYATPNEAALDLIDPDVKNNPVIFPPTDILQNMEIILPLSPQGQALYDRLWEQFLAAPPVKAP